VLARAGLTAKFFDNVAPLRYPAPGARPGRGAGARRGVRLDSPATVPNEVPLRLIGTPRSFSLSAFTLAPVPAEAQQADKSLE